MPKSTFYARHPRYTLLAAVIVVGVLLLLMSGPPQYPPFRIEDRDLPGRLEKSHEIYDKLLKQRQGLIKKFGPHPKDIQK
jgi:hypothetical protein